MIQTEEARRRRGFFSLQFHHKLNLDLFFILQILTYVFLLFPDICIQIILEKWKRDQISSDFFYG